MTVLLAADEVELYPAGDLDGHGWQEPDESYPPSWRGMGSLQLVGGLSDPRASTGGGHGPNNPARTEAGNLFLPPAALPVEGMTARVRGLVFVLSQVRLMVDPTDPGGGIGCWAATVSEGHHG